MRGVHEMDSALISTIFASIATVFNLLFNVPQIYVTYSCKDVKALSVYTILLRIIANVCWLVYVLLEVELLLSVTSGVNIMAEILLFYAKMRFKKVELVRV